MKQILVSIFLISSLLTKAQFTDIAQDSTVKTSLSGFQRPPFELADSTWVDSVLQSMSTREKIGQLFMVAAYSNKDEKHVRQIEKLVSEHNIGGLIFFQGGPVRQARLTNRYQQQAQIPLLIAMDAEWGLCMRLDSTVAYPRQMMMGAVQDDHLIYQMGQDMAEQCRRLGVHVSFSPVVDINNNPDNPVINSRSFGEQKERVASKGLAYMRGLQDGKVLACAKHFPGHGDTDTDSHKALPIIRHDKQRLNEVEIYPFRKLIDEGLGSVMTAHLFIPELDSTNNRASTLSPEIVTNVLENELNFRGLKFTDALNMKGVSSFYKPGEVDLLALKAGNDVLLFPEDVPEAIRRIEKAMEAGEFTEEELDRRVLKILQTKEWVGLDEEKMVEVEGLYQDLQRPAYEATKRNLVGGAMTLLSNNEGIVPFRNLTELKIAHVSIGGVKGDELETRMDQYGEVEHFYLAKDPKKDAVEEIKKELPQYNRVVFTFHKTSQYPRKKFGNHEGSLAALKELASISPSILVYFGNPYGLADFNLPGPYKSVMLGYQDMSAARDIAAQALFGAVSLTGKMPVSVNENLKAGAGLLSADIKRLRYGVPDEEEINAMDLTGIDEIALKGIEEQAYPGCQILVARNGKVIYEKSFGYHTYENKRPVSNTDLYDVASITKIAASTISFMHLKERGEVSLDDRVCYYLEDKVHDTSAYNSIIIRDMLAHQAGLISWIPFYKSTLIDGQPKYEFYSLGQSDVYPYKVSDRLYAHKDMSDYILDEILKKPLKKKEYKYSDLGYYFLKRIIEKQSGSPLNALSDSLFYQPLGMTRTAFNPLSKFSKEELTPTEYDLYFRKQQLHGTVHDPGAAMMGGVAGHAGLFSNANDLAKLMQMLLNWGDYGDRKYFEYGTVKEFTDCQFCEENRRGAGFDKPVTDGGPGPTCQCVSFASFGHSGFTGTIAWADPEEQLIYVFLSNRVYPDANNKKLVEMDIRTDIMQVIYDALPKKDSVSQK